MPWESFHVLIVAISLSRARANSSPTKRMPTSKGLTPRDLTPGTSEPGGNVCRPASQSLPGSWRIVETFRPRSLEMSSPSCASLMYYETSPAWYATRRLMVTRHCQRGTSFLM